MVQKVSKVEFQGVKGDAEELVTLALAHAEDLGVPRLLDPEDFVFQRVDNRSMITYLSFFPPLLRKEGHRLVYDISSYQRFVGS